MWGPQETPMDRAVRIAGTLTNAIKIMLKEPSINAGRRAKALEQLTHIFETATEKIEKRHENKPQTSSTPTTREEIRNTPRVHTRLTRNNTPRMILHKEKETEFFPNNKFQRVAKIQRVAKQ